MGILQEYPARSGSFTISNGSTPLSINDATLGQVPTPTIISVNYDQGLIYADPSLEGATLNTSYSGAGAVYLSASRVFTAQQNGTITQLLSQLVTGASNFIFQGTYNPSTTYNTYNIVSYLGVTYMYINSSSSSGNTPPNSTYWAKIAGGTTKGTYSTSTSYNYGDIVNDSQNQNVYQSLADNNLNNALTNTNYWQLLVSVASAITSATTATNAANTATSNANTATTNANNAATLANSTASNLSHKGTYSAATAYVPNNIVYYNGSSWMCISNTTGNAPSSSSTYWKKLGNFNWQGVYSTSTTYYYGDAVVDSATQNLYLSVADSNLNNALTNISFWTNIFNGATAITNLNNKTASLAFLGTYSGSTAYVPNNMVYSNGATYMCIANSTGNTPPNLTYWKKISSLNWKGTYSTSTTYYYGDVAIDSVNQNAYFSLVDSNINNALTNTSYWSLLVSTTSMVNSLNNYQFLGAYNASTNYVQNNQVSYNNSTYICIQNTTGNAPSNATYWSLFASSGSVGSVNSANSDITVTNPTTAPVLTLNSSTSPTASTIVKRDLGGGIAGVNAISHSSSLNALMHFENSLLTSRGVAGTFTRASVANDPTTLANVTSGTPIYQSGKYGKGISIWEGTTNLVQNSDFETFTGTATVFSDPLTSYSGSSAAPWTARSGSFTYSASGATSAVSAALVTAGNSAWKPLPGSGGQNLALTAQSTYVTPSTISNQNAAIYMYIDSNNWYAAYISSSGFNVSKLVNGSLSSVASVAFTPAASTTYTITLSRDTTGLLTAKLYSGTGTGGTLLQTLTATDTSLTGGFLLGVGGDTGVVISGTSVTAPWADGWTIGGDQRVAWALTNTNPISGNYSISAVGVNSPSSTPYINRTLTLSASTSYTASGYISAQSVGASGANIGLNNFGTTIYTPLVTGTTATTRYSTTGTSGTSGGQSISLIVNAAGTVVFDAIQVEAKSYATPYLRNDSTSASATRAAETLTYPSSLLNTSAFTISVWGKLSVAKSAYQMLIDLRSNSPINGFMGFSNGSAGTFIISNYTSQSIVTATVSNPTSWHHYVFSYDGTNIYLYVDGVKIGSVTGSGIVNNAANINFLVGNSIVNEYWDGTIDELTIFNRALTDAEVYSIYAATQPIIDVYQSDAATLAGNSVIPVLMGGTGSSTQNFVDLTTNQSIGGTKTFTGTATFNGSFAGSAILPVSMGGTGTSTGINAATTSALGTVQIASQPNSGNPIAVSRSVSTSEMQIISTSATSVVTHTPTSQKNYMVMASVRVITAATNVTITITWTDSAGSQTDTRINNQSLSVGTHDVPIKFLNSVSSQPITVTITAGTANQVYVSAAVVGV